MNNIFSPPKENEFDRDCVLDVRSAVDFRSHRKVGRVGRIKRDVVRRPVTLGDLVKKVCEERMIK